VKEEQGIIPKIILTIRDVPLARAIQGKLAISPRKESQQLCCGFLPRFVSALKEFTPSLARVGALSLAAGTPPPEGG
jgi:hypothetical protein